MADQSIEIAKELPADVSVEQAECGKSSYQTDYSFGDAPLLVNDADENSVTLHLYELWAYRELLAYLAWRDIKIKYKQTIMGAAWVIIQPLVMMLVFAIFFGVFVGVSTDGMPHMLFFYCGLLPWTFFSTTVSMGSLSLVNNSHLLSKVYFPRILIPAAVIGAGLVDLLIASLILIGFAVYYGASLTFGILMLPALLLLTVMLALGWSLWTAALTVKYRDIRHTVPFMLQVWFFVTPIVYSASVVPEKWRWILLVNPMAAITQGIRDSIAGRSFDWTAISAAALITITILLCSTYIFRRVEKGIVDIL
jgi:lipopolysaccharide transport system permease protein